MDTLIETNHKLKGYDTIVPIQSTYNKLKIRLEIISYLNDNRPAVIHQVSVVDSYETDFKYNYSCGASYDPFKNGISSNSFPGVREIPTVSSVAFSENNGKITSNYLTNNQYLHIKANESYIVDLIVESKKEQIRVVCKNQVCSTCKESERLIFKKTGSSIQFKVDMPDFQNNDEMLKDQTIIVSYAN